MKKFMAVVVCLLLLTAMIVTVSAEGTLRVSISTENSTVYCGDVIEFHIAVSGDGSCNAFGCFLEYDSFVLEFVDGSASVEDAMLSSMDSDGLVASYEFPTTPSGTVASFRMRVKEDAPFGQTHVFLDSYTDDGGMGNSNVEITVVCNHSYSDWQQYDGSYHQKICDNCGETKEEEHAWNEGIVVSAPTCKDTGSKIITCLICGEMKTETLDPNEDHSYTTFRLVDNDLHQSDCDICGYSLTASHTWDAGKETKKESCEETGFIKYTCTDCGHTKEEITESPSEHTFSPWSKADADTHSRRCSVCGKTETENHNWKGDSEGDTCLDCNTGRAKQTPISVSPTEEPGSDQDRNLGGEVCAASHSYGDIWKKDRTQHWRECENCGKKQDAENHTWDAGAKAKMGTVFTCTVCRLERFELRTLNPVIVGSILVAAISGTAVMVVLKRRKK